MLSDLWVPPSAEVALEKARRRRELAARPTVVLTGEQAADHIRARQELHARGMAPIGGGAVPGAGVVINSAAFAPGAAATKTAVAFVSGSNTPVDLIEFGVSTDALSGNLLIELTYSTGGTAGTAGSTSGAQVVRGPTQSLNATYGTSYTAEPGTQTRVKAWRFPMPGGPFVLQAPLGRELNSITAAATSGKQVCIRLTPSVAANLDTYVEIEE